jgi:hypothetical protein
MRKSNKNYRVSDFFCTFTEICHIKKPVKSNEAIPYRCVCIDLSFVLRFYQESKDQL